MHSTTRRATLPAPASSNADANTLALRGASGECAFGALSVATLDATDGPPTFFDQATAEVDSDLNPRTTARRLLVGPEGVGDKYPAPDSFVRVVGGGTVYLPSAADAGAVLAVQERLGLTAPVTFAAQSGETVLGNTTASRSMPNGLVFLIADGAGHWEWLDHGEPDVTRARDLVTTNATPTTIFQFAPPEGGTTWYEAFFAAYDATNNVGVAYKRRIACRRAVGGNAVVITGGVVSGDTGEDATVTSATVGFLTSTIYVVWQVTGLVGHSFTWAGKVKQILTTV
ncbi:MAG: hypothetical protein IT372_42605 [Polyangiaceae bacterium]|nr:hypothetical protein [Polyangiaceae bacterium]